MAEGRKEKTRWDRGRHPVDEVPPAGRLAVYGFRHVLAMYAGAVAVPLILTSAMSFGSPGNMTLALAVLLLILAICYFFSGFVSRIPILLGLILGTDIAMIFGITDFSGVAETSWLRVTTPFYFGVPTFHLFPII